MKALRDERIRQAENNLKSFGAFQNPDNLVFTDELGKHLVARTVVKHYKRIVDSLGIPERRYHDLRHSYATMALKSGDNIKDVQTNLGHSTVTITLDLYSHVTQEMKKASADRMENFIQGLKQA
jgi:integrase